MAIIGKIRSNVGLLIFVIALAMIAFLLMDVLSSSSRGGGQAQGQAIGTINGKEVYSQDYESRVQQIVNNYQSSNREVDDATRLQIREQAWTQFVQDQLSKEEFEKLGLDVTEAEMENILLSENNIHPSIQNAALFKDENGNFSRANLEAYIESFTDDTQEAVSRRATWKRFEESIINDQMRKKYTGLVSKAVYAPKWFAEFDHTDKNKKASISYVFAPYTGIQDSEISFSDSDLTSYIASNKNQFSQEETRSVKFVKFPVKPSESDSLATSKQITDQITNFKNASDISKFLSRQYSDTKYEGEYFTKDELKSSKKDALFGTAIGDVFGPFYENGTFKAARVIDRQSVADSVEIRIITRAINATRTPAAAKKTVDSLLTVLNAGGDFESLASAFSDDKSKENGGLIGYVPPKRFPTALNTAIFFDNKKGDQFTVTTPEGAHLVEILSANPTTEAIKVAFLTKTLEVSKETRDAVFAEANRFAGSNTSASDFEAAAQEVGKRTTTAASLTKNTYTVQDLGLAQDLVTWAFKANLGKVSDRVFQVDVDDLNGRQKTTYVVAALDAIAKAGSLESNRTLAETKVKNEKKAAKLSSTIGTPSSLDAVASATGQEVQTAEGIGFGDASIPNIGKEPKVQAAIFGLAANEVSKPIAGDRGVYVVKVNSFSDASAPSDMAAARKAATQRMKSTAEFNLFPALEKSVSVEDNRFKTRRF